MMKVFDHVVVKPLAWPWATVFGYDKTPGEIVHIQGEVISVKWQDGHVTLHLEDELLPYKS